LHYSVFSHACLKCCLMCSQNVHSLDHWVLSSCECRNLVFRCKISKFSPPGGGKISFQTFDSGLLYMCALPWETPATCTHTYDVNFMCKVRADRRNAVQRGKNAEIGASTHFWNISTLSSILGETLVCVRKHHGCIRTHIHVYVYYTYIVCIHMLCTCTHVHMRTHVCCTLHIVRTYVRTCVRMC